MSRGSSPTHANHLRVHRVSSCNAVAFCKVLSLRFVLLVLSGGVVLGEAVACFVAIPSRRCHQVRGFTFNFMGFRGTPGMLVAVCSACFFRTLAAVTPDQSALFSLFVACRLLLRWREIER